ncbi:MAG: DHH family phosphoesterase, partial [Bacteroidetes bacterium]|nr:DHH family phosphoesterase [Bacteroidota bacterium]
MEKRWVIKERADAQDVEHIATVLNVDKIVANLLVQRGIKTYDEAKSFFRPDLANLHDPFLMKDMDKAVGRLTAAIENKEKILIYGDYDVDGTTSVAMMYSFLKNRLPEVLYYIPDRDTEGYGLSMKGIDYAFENGCKLIIALDCGIKANEKVDYANAMDIDIIICDHHNPGETLPDAAAILDPKQPGCEYPYKDLSGCGVGFKLLQAYAQSQELPKHQDYQVAEELIPYLDLVAVSIASDIVPIFGENRILAYYGLKQINENPRIGLRSVMEVAGIEKKQVEINDIVFKIGPRINAAGRIESGQRSVDLLIAEEKEDAERISLEVNEYNITRQNIDQQITEEA